MTEKSKFIFKQSIIIFCLTILFTIIVFLLKNYYFSTQISNEYIEENYIEPVAQSAENIFETEQEIEETIEKIWSWSIESEIINSDLKEVDGTSMSGSEISSLIEEHYRSASPFVFKYIPEYFKETSQDFSKSFWSILQSKAMKQMIYDLHVEMHEDLLDVRWKMKNRSVKLFWYTQERQAEYTSVAIHELAHFIDIYFLEKKVLQDISDEFYNISWRETKIIKPWQSQADFVSGYAMTNKYEDFAESFTYYLLHNEDFLRKTLSSERLSAKYDFFDTVIFKKKFHDTDFSVGNTVQEYYRDITKIDIDVEKLLQYLKNWI